MLLCQHVLLLDSYYVSVKNIFIILQCKFSVWLLQDLLMVTYLANLTQAQIALNEKLVLL